MRHDDIHVDKMCISKWYRALSRSFGLTAFLVLSLSVWSLSCYSFWWCVTFQVGGMVLASSSFRMEPATLASLRMDSSMALVCCSSQMDPGVWARGWLLRPSLCREKGHNTKPVDRVIYFQKYGINYTTKRGEVNCQGNKGGADAVQTNNKQLYAGASPPTPFP